MEISQSAADGKKVNLWKRPLEDEVLLYEYDLPTSLWKDFKYRNDNEDEDDQSECK